MLEERADCRPVEGKEPEVLPSFCSVWVSHVGVEEVQSRDF